jgi:isoleucyl-tRNA synthetase
MFEKPDYTVGSTALDAAVSEYWSTHDTFAKSLRLHEDEHVFYDGPPFPTGTPHHGTVFVSILKDSLARFFTMQGTSVPRVWGWDCHGLPIETAVERMLGLSNKKQIEEELGVAAFNDACRALVSNYNDAWELYIQRVGRWVDYRNPYRTMDRDYMESVIWAFAESRRRGLIYRDYRVTPYCYRCETSLSIADTRESDSTRPRKDPAVTVKFRLRETPNELPTYLLAWTTTPWTLTANLALAVRRDLEYAAVEQDGEIWIMGAFALQGGESVRRTIAGEALVGRAYEPVFPFAQAAGEITDDAFRVLAADFVSSTEGTGIVHIAPAFGEDDYWAARANGIGVWNPVDPQGVFSPEVPPFAGRKVHEANDAVIAALQDRGVVVRRETIEHNYPHCWRCRTPLIYRAMRAWYFRVERIKERLLAHNEAIHWVPETVKHGRFGKWLEGARDWNISRNRYWGTPIPVWECEACGATWVAGSRAELERAAGRELADLHKEHLDRITVACRCGAEMKRTPEVLDGWFESGAMPFAQCHYPFENGDWFAAHYPADFITEYPGQIRGWFYYLHVLAVALMDRAAFRTCLVHGTLLSESGGKISKSLSNYTDPMELLDRYGADALRLYLLRSPAATMADLKFADADVEAQLRDVLLPLWNVYSFFATYANIDDYEPTGSATAETWPHPKNELDRWILARLCQTGRWVTQGMEAYRTNNAAGPLAELIADLSTWYVRRSRSRFWRSGMDADKQGAYDTLYQVLVTVSQLLAPFTPFIAEALYRGLTAGESVHLSDWPVVPERLQDDELVAKVATSRLIVRLALSLRQRAGIRVRQPLKLLRVAMPGSFHAVATAHGAQALRDEVNVKEVVFVDDPEELGALRVVPNARRIGPVHGKDTQRIIAAAKAGRVRLGADTVEIRDGGDTWHVPRADVTVGYTASGGVDVAADRGIVVALDTEVTEELRREGELNDLNRRVQSLRKSAGLDVADRIVLELAGDIPDEWKHHVSQTALAELGRVDKPEAEARLHIHGTTVTVRLARLGAAVGHPRYYREGVHDEDTRSKQV